MSKTRPTARSDRQGPPDKPQRSSVRWHEACHQPKSRRVSSGLIGLRRGAPHLGDPSIDVEDIEVKTSMSRSFRDQPSRVAVARDNATTCPSLPTI
jgi:hypothetical protein